MGTSPIPFPGHPFTNYGSTTGVCSICDGNAPHHEKVAYGWQQVSSLDHWETYCFGCKRYNNSGKRFCPLCLSDAVRPVGLLGKHPPRQCPLFTLPPIAEATAWKIEWRWRDGERNILTDEPYPTCWFLYSTYKIKKRAKSHLRRLRYGQGRRKLFRMEATLFEHKGDIECHVPDPPAVSHPLLLVKPGSVVLDNIQTPDPDSLPGTPVD